jgi:hypothetical protein
MSAELFPGLTFYRLEPFDDEGYVVNGSYMEFQQCFRCGSLVLDRDQHVRWHRAVDTAETTDVGR